MKNANPVHYRKNTRSLPLKHAKQAPCGVNLTKISLLLTHWLKSTMPIAVMTIAGLGVADMAEAACSTTYTSTVNGPATIEADSCIVTDTKGISASSAGKDVTANGALYIETSGNDNSGVYNMGAAMFFMGETTIQTSGDYAYGLYAKNGSISVTGPLSINTVGKDSVGVSIGGTAHVELAETTIQTTGYQSFGMSLWGGTASVTGPLFISTEGQNASGIKVSGSDTSLELSETTIHTSGSFGTGLAVLYDASVHSTGPLSIETTGDNATGISIQHPGSEIHLAETTIQTSGYMATALYGAGGIISVTGPLSITTLGKSSTGLMVSDNSTVSVTGALTLSTFGEKSYAIRVLGVGSNLQLAQTTVQTEGDDAIGLYIGADGTASVTGPLSITTSGKSAFGVRLVGENASLELSEATIYTSGESASGLKIEDGNTSVTGPLSITTTGQSASGVSVSGTATNVQLAQTTIQTEKNYATGLYISGGSTSVTGPLSITTSGQSAMGVAVGGTNASLELSDTTIHTSGSSAFGLKLDSGSTSVTGPLLVTTTGQSASGVVVSGTATNVQLAQTTIQTSGQDSPGLYILNGTASVTGPLSINTAGNNSQGIYALSEGHAEFADVTIQTSGYRSYGIENGGGVMILTGVTAIETSGAYSHGLGSMWGGTIFVRGPLSINTTGDDSHGVYSNNGSDIELAEATIQTSGQRSSGLYILNGTASVTGPLSINTTGDGSQGIYASGSDIELAETTIQTSGDDSHGLWAMDGGTISVTGPLSINTSAEYSYGIYASGSDIELAETTIQTSGKGSSGLYILNGTASANGLLSINTSADYSHGIYALSEGHAEFADVTIQTSGQHSNGLYILNGTASVTGLLSINTTGDYSRGIYTSGSDIELAETTIQTSGQHSSGLSVGYGTASVTGPLSINTTGNYSHGIVIYGADSNVLINDPNSTITTQGESAHGIWVASESSKTFDGSAGNILPTIEVSGAGSAAVAASDGGTLTLAQDVSLNMDMTQGEDTWGAKAEGGTLVLTDNSSTGGTGLWALSGTIKFSGDADAAGSNIKLDSDYYYDDTPSVLDLTGLSGTFEAGSLEGTDAGSVVMLGDKDMILGVNNAANNGSLLHDAHYAGVITGDANSTLTKQGDTIQHFSGTGSQVGTVDVYGGALSFEQSTFNVQGDYTTHAGGTTAVGIDGGLLNVDGTFTQEDDANLVVTITNSGTAEITATDAYLSGSLVVNGFSYDYDGDGTAITASELEETDTYVLIHTTEGIYQDDIDESFINSDDYVTSADYLLTQDGHVTEDGKDYHIAFHLAWTAEPTEASGTFTVAEGTAFNVDIELADREDPYFYFRDDDGWGGQDLVKSGDGLLIFSAQNSYTGSTTVNGGELRMEVDNAFAQSSDLIVNGGVLNLNGFDQSANRLSGEGGQILLGEATLTVNNAQAELDDTHFAGEINGSGSLVKEGEGSLTLSGQSTIGTTQISEGSLIVEGESASLTSHIVGESGTQFSIQNGATFTGSIDPTDVYVGESSTWNMTESSTVSSLDNAGAITFTNTTAPGNTLTVQGDYVGNNGLITLNSVLEDDASASDKLIVEGSTSGSTRLAVNHVGGGGAETDQGIEVVSVGGTSDGEFTLEGRAVAGAYEYALYQGTPEENDGNWYLRSDYTDSGDGGDGGGDGGDGGGNGGDGGDGGGDGGEDGGGTDGGGGPVLRPEVGAYLANQHAANTMFVQSLHERLGESQYANDARGTGQQGSTWVRFTGSDQSNEAGNGQISTDTTSTLIQVGADLIRWQSNESRINAGLMFSSGSSRSHNDARHNTARADAELDGYALGVYGTWYGARNAKNEGVYVDSWLQYGHYSNRVRGSELEEQDYDSKNWIGSVEAGYAFALTSQENNAWFIEPQGQLLYTHYSQDDITEANGTRVSAQDTDGISGRLGLRVYARQAFENGVKFKPFAEINWLYGQNAGAVQMDQTTIQSDVPNNRYQIKLGGELELAKNWNAWGNVGYEVGANAYKKVSGLVGVKYIW